jgi:hypothetical protein
LAKYATIVLALWIRKAAIIAASLGSVLKILGIFNLPFCTKSGEERALPRVLGYFMPGRLNGRRQAGCAFRLRFLIAGDFRRHRIINLASSMQGSPKSISQ